MVEMRMTTVLFWGCRMFAGSAVAWFSRTQQAVALAGTEAECMAMGESTVSRKYLEIRSALSGVEDNTMWVCEDNMEAINMAENPSSSARSKHVDVRHHFLRQLVQDRVIEILPTPTNSQHADILTKPLGESLFKFMLVHC
ncbi:unnamed protein product [Discosporangium mesarthrocarpum]